MLEKGPACVCAFFCVYKCVYVCVPTCMKATLQNGEKERGDEAVDVKGLVSARGRAACVIILHASGQLVARFRAACVIISSLCDHQQLV